MVRRTVVLLYGLFAYTLFLGSFLYAVGFIGGFLTPTRLDGPREGSLGVALAINGLLLALFALQHSGMARPRFKAWLTRFIPKPAERPTYVLLSSVALFLLFALWQPLGGEVWTVTDETARIAVYSLFAAGWGIVLYATFLINHFDLFGLRQVWLEFRGKPYTPLPFKTPAAYRVVRHPLYVGWLITFWATPTMTESHLLFAVVTTLYILAAIGWEERDLMAAHPEYAAYRRLVPMLVPGMKAGEKAESGKSLTAADGEGAPGTEVVRRPTARASGLRT
jgi:protein-S-isoprenylcysteine O-methyltransferase Ste14